MAQPGVAFKLLLLGCVSLSIQWHKYANSHSSITSWLSREMIIIIITDSPNGPVLFCSLASIVVCNAAGGLTGRPPGAWAVGWPTLHFGPVLLRPVMGTPCYFSNIRVELSEILQRCAFLKFLKTLFLILYLTIKSFRQQWQQWTAIMTWTLT